MGATVTTGKLVNGFIVNSKVYYVLFEETYEKNVIPHRPSWSCVAIGSYQDVMKRVFQCAASAYDGSLQNRQNNLSAEAYIRSWASAFGKPLFFHDTNISFRILERDKWRDGIESTAAGNLYEKLMSIGRLDVWDKLMSNNDDTFSLNLYDDPELIVELFGVNGIASPWRIINNTYMNAYGEVDESLIPKKTKNTSLVPVDLEIIKLPGNGIGLFEYAVKNDLGFYAGIDDDITQKVIVDQAYQNEIQSHGNGVKCITQFIDDLAKLPVVDSSEFDYYVDLSEIKTSKFLTNYFEHYTGLSLENCIQNIDASNQPDIPYVMKIDCNNLSDVSKKYYFMRSCIMLSNKQKQQLAA